MSLYIYKQMKSEFFIHICIVFERHRTDRMIAYSNNVACCSKHFWPLSLKWPSESLCRSQKKVHLIVTGPSFKVITPSPPFSSYFFLPPHSWARCCCWKRPTQRRDTADCRGPTEQEVSSSAFIRMSVGRVRSWCQGEPGWLSLEPWVPILVHLLTCYVTLELSGGEAGGTTGNLYRSFLFHNQFYDLIAPSPDKHQQSESVFHQPQLKWHKTPKFEKSITFSEQNLTLIRISNAAAGINVTLKQQYFWWEKCAC